MDRTYISLNLERKSGLRDFDRGKRLRRTLKKVSTAAIQEYHTELLTQKTEFNGFPIPRIHITHVLRQRMLVVLPIDGAYAVRHNIRSI